MHAETFRNMPKHRTPTWGHRSNIWHTQAHTHKHFDVQQTTVKSWYSQNRSIIFLLQLALLWSTIISDMDTIRITTRANVLTHLGGGVSDCTLTCQSGGSKWRGWGCLTSQHFECQLQARRRNNYAGWGWGEQEWHLPRVWSWRDRFVGEGGVRVEVEGMAWIIHFKAKYQAQTLKRSWMI